jgi:hypothetical protein
VPKAEQLEEWQTAVEKSDQRRRGRRRPDYARADRRHESLEPSRRAGVRPVAHRHTLGPAKAQEGPMKTVFVYVNTSKQVGDADHIKVFANLDAAEKWFEENDPEGVAFEYEVLE